MRALLAAAALALAAPAARAGCAADASQAELTQCAYLDWQAADARLNLAYHRARGAMRSIDLALPAYDQGAERTLRDAQRLWLEVRDQSCLAASWSAKGGTAQQMLVYSCMARMSEERAAWLDSLAGGF